MKDYEATEDVDIPEYVELTADVTDFSLNFTATIISNGMFGDMDTDDLKMWMISLMPWMICQRLQASWWTALQAGGVRMVGILRTISDRVSALDRGLHPGLMQG